MKQFIVTAYTFDELAEAVRNKVLKKAEDKIIEHKFMFFQEDAPEWLKADGIVADVYYSLGYCQGDGLMFACSDLLASESLRQKLWNELNDEERQIFEKLEDGYMTINTTCTRNYYFASADDVEIDIYRDLTEAEQQTADKVKTIAVAWYLEECKRLERMGYDCYNITDEDIADYFEDRLFTADGAEVTGYAKDNIY